MTDSILFWNAVTLEANRVSHSDPAKREQNGPTLSSRAMAIVHLAMYDAYAGVANNAATFPRYNGGGPAAPAGATVHRDAVAGAAFTALSALFARQVDYFEAQLSAFDRTNASFQYGVDVAKAILALRANDPDSFDAGYQPSNLRGRHRVDPDNPGQRFDSPYYGAQSEAFAVTSRHPLDRPPFDKPEYLAALRQVRADGIKPELMATLPDALFPNRRTMDQTVQGTFWAYDGANGLGTPPRLYNLIIREVAMQRDNPGTGAPNDEGQNARLFAFVNAALGDAGILAWEQKYCHDFWRPVVGIREHEEAIGPGAVDADADNDLNNDGDPFWLPLGAPSTNTNNKNFTPNFPAYPSGHATFGAAAFHVTRLFYGVPKGNRKRDDLFKDLVFVSEEMNGQNRDNQGTVRPRHVRNFPDGLWQIIIENARSRIYLGVHWVFDAFTVKKPKNEPDLGRNIGGVVLGLNIAEDIFMAGNKLAPVMTPPGTAKPAIDTPAPRSIGIPRVPKQPADEGNCANKVVKTTKKTAGRARPQSQAFTEPFPRGNSPR
jgi:hypothetical protein